MNRERAKELLPIITAFVNHETIQFKDSIGNWQDVDWEPSFFKDTYRIKPKPVTRPWNKPEHIKCGALFDGGKQELHGISRAKPSVIISVEHSGFYAGYSMSPSIVKFTELDGSECYAWPCDDPKWIPCTVTEEA